MKVYLVEDNKETHKHVFSTKGKAEKYVRNYLGYLEGFDVQDKHYAHTSIYSNGFVFLTITEYTVDG